MEDVGSIWTKPQNCFVFLYGARAYASPSLICHGFFINFCCLCFSMPLSIINQYIRLYFYQIISRQFSFMDDKFLQYLGLEISKVLLLEMFLYPFSSSLPTTKRNLKRRPSRSTKTNWLVKDWMASSLSETFSVLLLVMKCLKKYGMFISIFFIMSQKKEFYLSCLSHL